MELNFWTWQRLAYVFIFTTLSKEANSSTDNKTLIPHQVYQPLGSCPCDLTVDVCDLRCCCDPDCSFTVRQLFESHCLPGPFGGNVSVVTDYQCSDQASENTPDWFPFLCVISSAENSPLLGHYYSGKTVTPRGTPSFKSPKKTLQLPVSSYKQGTPIFTATDEYFTIPQISLMGHCVENAPVAYLENFQTECISYHLSCPFLPTDLAVDIRDGYGGIVTINVSNNLGSDQTDQNVNAPYSQFVFCKNVTLALNYTFYWRREGLSGITLMHTIGDVYLNNDVPLITKISATFVNGDIAAQPHSGTSGYLVGRPVIGGVMSPTMSPTTVIHRATLSLWHSGTYGLCESASLRSVIFGVNSTSGCMLPVSLDNFTECSILRDTVQTILSSLVTSTLIARNGNPDFYSLADWVNVTNVVQNLSKSVNPGYLGLCENVPSQLHIIIHRRAAPQTQITAAELRYKATTWRLQCEVGTNCQSLNTTQSFPLISSVSFSEELSHSIRPKTRFQINFTEFDCARNDVCWTELAFPFTRYYTGEPSSQALAKGMSLVFIFMIASLLGSPWKQIRQVWNNTQL